MTTNNLQVRWIGDPPPSAPVDPVSPVDYTEGLWDKLTGTSWMYSDGNPACLIYAMRSGFAGLPTDDNVHYVKIGGLGYLVHETELEEVPS